MKSGLFHCRQYSARAPGGGAKRILRNKVAQSWELSGAGLTGSLTARQFIAGRAHRYRWRATGRDFAAKSRRGVTRVGQVDLLRGLLAPGPTCSGAYLLRAYLRLRPTAVWAYLRLALLARLPFLADFLRGTFFPAARASDKPIAMACLRLFTFFPERPLRNVPCLRSCIAFLTLRPAALLYLRAMNHLELTRQGWWFMAAHGGCRKWPRQLVRRKPVARRKQRA